MKQVGVAKLASKRIDGMMCVVIVEAAQDIITLIRMIVTVDIAQQHQVTTLSDVDAFGSEFKTQRHMQTIGKYRLFISLSIVVGIFQNQ